ADYSGGERGAFAAVFFKNVLNDLLAPLVPQNDIDIGWLAAFAPNEALEQQLRLVGRDLSDMQAITHYGIGGGTAALAENVVVAGEAHDVMHGQKIIFVLELVNQRQFGSYAQLNIGRHALRPAFGGAESGQMRQISGGC